MIQDILLWWLVVQILGLLGLPLTTFLLRSLPDRGYAFSKSLGLLLTGYGAWLLAMFGLGSFGVPLLVLVALLMGGLGLALMRTMHPLDPDADLSSTSRFGWLRALVPQKGVLLAYEALFLVALVALAWMRSYNPDPWGTERPMDFAFFNAIRNSAAFPPQDPWLAGYSINYYYLGYLLMAAVALLSGRDPASAYNLSLALIFALTALGVAGIIYNLIALTPGITRTPTPPDAKRPREWRTGIVSHLLVMLLGVILVLGVGNQVGALQMIIGDYRVVALDGRQLVAALTQAVAGHNPIELPYPAQTPDYEFGSITTLTRSQSVDTFNWWWSSRALWDDYASLDQSRSRQYTITEFPFFSFWLGDMHPHVMALPAGLLAMALALATLARPSPPQFAHGRIGWVDLVMTGLVLGSLYLINSWDLPTYVLLYTGALLLLYVRSTPPGADLPWRTLGLQLGMVLVALLILYVPFYLTFHSLVGAANPLIDLPLLGKLTQIIGPFNVTKSGLHAFLIIFGLFVLPLTAFVYLAVSSERQTSSADAAHLAFVSTLPKTMQRIPLDALLPWLPPFLLLLGLAIGFPLLALLGLGILAFRQALRPTTNPAQPFVLLVIALGCAITFGTELIYIRDAFEGLSARMNTIFKFYYQVWLLWGTITAYALWVILTRSTGRRRVFAYATGLICALLLAGSMVYPAINLYNMIMNGTQMGLAGKTPRETSAAGQAAIYWLRQNVPSGRVVLEGVHPTGGSYNGEGFGGVSASTGLPTVIGWTGHESQWRGGDADARAEIEPRKQDVETIYSTPDPAQARRLLKQYGVDYIYVGSLERQTYPAEGLAKFNILARPVFTEDDVTIYQVE